MEYTVYGTMLFNPRRTDAWGTDNEGAGGNDCAGIPKNKQPVDRPHLLAAPLPGTVTVKGSLPLAALRLTLLPTLPPAGGTSLRRTAWRFRTAPSSFTQNTFSHFPSQGFDVLFTDGSVDFVQNCTAFQFISTGQLAGPGTPSNEGAPVPQDYDAIYNWLENGQ